MSKVADLLQERGGVIEQMKSILNSAETQQRDLTKSEQTLYDKLNKQQVDLKARADRLSEMNSLEEGLDTLQGTPSRPVIGGQGFDPRSAAELDYLRTGSTAGLVNNGLSIGTDSDGGYTFLPSLSKNLVETIADANPILANVHREMVQNTDEFLKVFTVSGAESGRVAEDATRTASATPTFARPSIKLSMQYAYPKITEELAHASWFELEAFLAREVATAFDADWEAEMLTGSGTAPAQKGILTAADSTAADSSRSFNSYQISVTSAGQTAVTTDELLTLLHSLPARYRKNAKFYCSTGMMSLLRKLKDGDSRYLLHGLGQQGNEGMAILGHEIVEVTQMPSISAGSKSIMFGDLKQAYSFVSHVDGLQVFRDPYTEPGWIKYYTRLYCGSGPMDTRALKVLQQAA